MIVTDRIKLSIPVPMSEVNDHDAESITTNMFKILKDIGGYGLSANQINRSERICIINVDTPFYLVNPTITSVSDETIVYVEGCLSIPNTIKKPLKTIRYKSIQVSADNYSDPLTFEPNEETWSSAEDYWNDRGLLQSVAVQHEIDHLNGRTIYDNLFRPPILASKKISRNEKVMIMNNRTTETKFLKYKKALPLLNDGWQIL